MPERPYRRKLSTDQEEEICDRYRAGETTRTSGKVFGAHPRTIGRILARHGVARRTLSETARKYACDHTFFNCIDTEEKAYWLGFLAADGAVVGNAVVVTLSAADEQHLQRFKAALRSEHPVKRYVMGGYKPGVYSRFVIRSEELAKGLITHSVVHKKTLILRWPEHLDDDLKRHYLRGYTDGDGGYHLNTAGRERGHRAGVW